MKSIKKTFILIIPGLFFIQLLAEGQLCTTKEPKPRRKKDEMQLIVSNGCIADNFFLWDVGHQIQVKFTNGTPEQQALVLSLAKEWEKYANIKFVQVNTEPSSVRIEFGTRTENYSLLGTDAYQEDPSRHTLYLCSALFNDSILLKQMVLHQFGHVLGLLHERDIPPNGIQWNKDSIYKHFAALGWTRETTDQQIIDNYYHSYSNGKAYDSASIMHYPIAKWQTIDGFEKKWNGTLSEGDKQLAELLYPYTGNLAKDVPRINILNYTTTKIKADKTAGGINLYPSFNIKTFGDNREMYIAVIVYNKDGYPILATDEKYNLNGGLASYKILHLGPGKNLSVNKDNPEEFPLFIPFINIPNTPENSEIQVVFRAYVSDGKDQKSIFFSSPVSYQMGSR